MNFITYEYKFIFPDGNEKNFIINLDDKMLNLIEKKEDIYPEWTKLDYYQCPNCPFKKKTTPLCPIAKNIVPMIDLFKNIISYEEAEVIIKANERDYSKKTTAQKGLSALLGIYMVTCGCPIMEKLKPMVYSHLPFASLEETAYRVLSMYLLAQFFLKRKGKKPDWKLKKLTKIYEEIEILNTAFAKRLAHIEIQDATLNAIVILSNFGNFVNFALTENRLDRIEMLFQAYLD